MQDLKEIVEQEVAAHLDEVMTSVVLRELDEKQRTNIFYRHDHLMDTLDWLKETTNAIRSIHEIITSDDDPDQKCVKIESVYSRYLN